MSTFPAGPCVLGVEFTKQSFNKRWLTGAEPVCRSRSPAHQRQDGRRARGDARPRSASSPCAAKGSTSVATAVGTSPTTTRAHLPWSFSRRHDPRVIVDVSGEAYAISRWKPWDDEVATDSSVRQSGGGVVSIECFERSIDVIPERRRQLGGRRCHTCQPDCRRHGNQHLDDLLGGRPCGDRCVDTATVGRRATARCDQRRDHDQCAQLVVQLGGTDGISHRVVARLGHRRHCRPGTSISSPTAVAMSAAALFTRAIPTTGANASITPTISSTVAPASSAAVTLHSYD